MNEDEEEEGMKGEEEKEGEEKRVWRKEGRMMDR